MKLHMIIGLLLAGSLFVGTGVRAQDLTEKYLDALEAAHEALATVTTARERQEAAEDVQEVETAMQRVTPQIFIPGIGTIWVVSVECNSECGEEEAFNLGQICASVGSGFLPFAVDCRDVDDDPPGDPCGGDNKCFARSVSSTDRLSAYCDDTSGWDAQVYCVRP